MITTITRKKKLIGCTTLTDKIVTDFILFYFFWFWHSSMFNYDDGLTVWTSNFFFNIVASQLNFCFKIILFSIYRRSMICWRDAVTSRVTWFFLLMQPHATTGDLKKHFPHHTSKSRETIEVKKMSFWNRILVGDNYVRKKIEHPNY